MKKYIDLKGLWQFSLDPEKQGISKQFFRDTFDDAIYLPGTTSIAQKGLYNDKKETGHPSALMAFCWHSLTNMSGQPAKIFRLILQSAIIVRMH